MFEHADIWKMLAGVALFILGMKFMEGSLRDLAGRPFKLFLKRYTAGRVKGILGGALVTAVMQSSSVVNLMLLAFVGAGILGMPQALSVMLGANLGTTLTSWMVATLGFKLNIDLIALPVTGIAGIALVFFKEGGRAYSWSRFLLGFGLLFVGLSFMKTGIEQSIAEVDLSAYRQYPLIVFVVLGFVLTSLIQSSSAAVAITLSALNAGALTLLPAMAIVLGAEIGTTVKVVLASAGGSVAKKRVAWGNLSFNIVTSVLVFPLLPMLARGITGRLLVNDPVMALVLFQTIVNLISILIFLPLLGVLSRWLERRFRHDQYDFILLHQVPLTDAEMGVDVMRREARKYLKHVIDYGAQIFGITNTGLNTREDLYAEVARGSLEEKYDFLKQQHGELLDHYLKIHRMPDAERWQAVLEKLMSTVRNGMYAAKSFKDSVADLQQLRNSSKDRKYRHYLQTRAEMERFFRELTEWLTVDAALPANRMLAFFRSVQHQYLQTLEMLYRDAGVEGLNEVEMSTLLNFNREVITGCKSMVMACKDLLLSPEAAKELEDLPGFIR